ncbi:Regulatory protein BlaR1 [Neorhodopirellula pilleata]|uniref:Regulatory protein BlaR1 n=2 Tax=Neorhodopirellula pilleata TaxID=2714738 RepID=A0A5C6AC22_9BACT|nr:Regulatory protein BlaR1 [Neorhodopirellula pilleata]
MGPTNWAAFGIEHAEASSAYLCWLWLIVVARLLLPVSVPSVVAISSVADAPVQALLLMVGNGGYDRVEVGTFTVESSDGIPVTVAQIPDDATAEQQAEANAYVAKINAQALASGSANGPLPQFNQVELSDNSRVLVEPNFNLLNYLLILVIPAIGIILILRGIASHLRFVWKLRTLPAVTERDTIDCLLRVCDDVGVGRRPKLKEVPSLDAPAMFGMLWPTVCLPIGWREKLTMEQLEWVFRHEVAHVQGRDGLLLFVATLARSIHWFNPLSWIAVSKLQNSIERAADEVATLHLTGTQVREYGELLLRFATDQPETRRRPTIGLLSMAAPKDLSRRIASLGTPVRRVRWLRSLVAIAVITMVAACGLTDAKTVQPSTMKPRPIPNIEVALAELDWKKINRPDESRDQQERRVVSINVEKALQKAKEMEAGIDAERFAMTYFGFFPATNDQSPLAEIVDGFMTVQVTPQQEALIRQTLSAFEQSGLWQIVTELRVIDTDIRFLDPFDWSLSDSTVRCRRLDRSPSIDGLVDNDHTYIEGPSLSINMSGASNEDLPEFNVEQSVSLPVRATKINHLESVNFIHQVQSDVRSNIMMAPKVTMFNGQRGLISDCVQRPFVTDVLEVAGDFATALQPKISVIEDGWKFLIKTSVTAEERVKLQMVFTQSSVDGVKFANLPNTRGNNFPERLTIQVPTVHSDTIAVESVLNEDEALLVFSPRPYSDEEDGEHENCGDGMGQVFMIRTTLIPDNDFLKSFVPRDRLTPESQPNK